MKQLFICKTIIVVTKFMKPSVLFPVSKYFIWNKN